MPQELHRKLEREAHKKGMKGKRKDAYVYGTMNKVMDAKPPKEHKAMHEMNGHMMKDSEMKPMKGKKHGR